MFTHWFVSNNGVLKFNVRRRETSESDIARYNRSRAGGRYAESNPVSCNPKNQIWDDAEKSWYAICTDPAAESTVGYIPPVWHAPLWLDRASFRSRRIPIVPLWVVPTLFSIPITPRSSYLRLTR